MALEQTCSLPRINRGKCTVDGLSLSAGEPRKFWKLTRVCSRAEVSWAFRISIYYVLYTEQYSAAIRRLEIRTRERAASAIWLAQIRTIRNIGLTTNQKKKRKQRKLEKKGKRKTERKLSFARVSGRTERIHHKRGIILERSPKTSVRMIAETNGTKTSFIAMPGGTLISRPLSHQRGRV